MPEAPLLSVSALNAWYGESHILHGVSFEVPRGEVVTLLGRNGAGKTTTLKSVMGMVGRREGSVRFGGKELVALPSNRIARLGLAFCPEERGIFASLNVHENLLLPPVVRAGGLPVGQVFDLFPNLKERLSSQGTKLSGGEQQMLAIGRALMGGPKVLMLDEPSTGLAPKAVAELYRNLSTLKSGGLTIIVTEQQVALALSLTDRAYVLEQGAIRLSGRSAELLGDPAIKKAYLGVA